MGSFQNHLINGQSGATCMFSPLMYRNCTKFYCKKKRQWVECSCWSMPSNPFLWERLLNTSSRSWKMHGVSSSWPMPMWLHCNTGWILLHLWYTRINPNTFLQLVKQDVLVPHSSRSSDPSLSSWVQRQAEASIKPVLLYFGGCWLLAHTP